MRGGFCHWKFIYHSSQLMSTERLIYLQQLSNKRVHQNPQGPSRASTWHAIVQGWHCLARTIFGGFSSLHRAIQHSDCQKPIQALQVLPPPFYISFLPHLPNRDLHINGSFLLVSSIYDWSRMVDPHRIPTCHDVPSLPLITPSALPPAEGTPYPRR